MFRTWAAKRGAGVALLSDRTAKDLYYSGKTIFREPPRQENLVLRFLFFFFFFPTPTSCSAGSLIVHPATRGKFPSPSQYFLSSHHSHRNRLIAVSPPFVSLPLNSFASQEEGHKQSLPITAMFTSSLRRQSPALLRFTPLSIRALTSSSSKSSFVRSRPLKTAILSSSSAQRRFFAISSYLRDEASASAQFADLDPPAGEYAHSGQGHEHHFKNQGPITRFQQLADNGLVNPSLINTITKGLGYDEMTKVQQKTILETVNGENVYVFPHLSLIYFL